MNPQRLYTDTQKLSETVLAYINEHPKFTNLELINHFRDEYDSLQIMLTLEELRIKGMVEKR